MKRVAKEIDLSYWKQFSSHRLSHTFATRCIEADISLPVLQTLIESKIFGKNQNYK